MSPQHLGSRTYKEPWKWMNGQLSSLIFLIIFPLYLISLTLAKEASFEPFVATQPDPFIDRFTCPMNNTLIEELPSINAFPSAYLKQYDLIVKRDEIYGQLCLTPPHVLERHTKRFSGGNHVGDDTVGIQTLIKSLGESCKIGLQRRRLYEYKNMGWDKRTRLIYTVRGQDRVLCAIIYHFTWDHNGFQAAELIYWVWGGIKWLVLEFA